MLLLNNLRHLKFLLSVLVLLLGIRFLVIFFFGSEHIPGLNLAVPRNLSGALREFLIAGLLRLGVDAKARSLLLQLLRSIYESLAFKVFIFLLTTFLLKMYLVGDFRVNRVPAAGYDDLLFIAQADFIMYGHWLGQYSHVALVKGPIYSIFLAINGLLGTPLLHLQNALYALSLLVMTGILIQNHLKKWLAVLTYLICFFLPVTYAGTHLRSVRDFFYASMVILSCALLARCPFSSQKSSLYLGAAAGISTGLMWYTREESILFLGPILLCVTMAFINKRWKAIGAGLVMFFALTFALKLTNYMKYGTFEIIDSTSGQFVRAYHNIIKVEDGAQKPQHLVTRATRLKLYEASPAFRTLQPFIDPPGEPKEYSGSHFMWAIRLAAANAGYYDNPDKAEDFFRKLANEIDNACENGDLKCPVFVLNGIPMKLEWVPLLWDRFIGGFKYLWSSYGGFDLDESFAFHRPSPLYHNMFIYEQVTHQVYTEQERLAERAYSKHPQKYIFSGNIKNMKDDPVIAIKSSAKYAMIPFLNRTFDEIDFVVVASCEEDCSLRISSKTKEEFFLKGLKDIGTINNMQLGDYTISIKKEDYKGFIPLPKVESIRFKLDALNFISGVYQVFIKWVVWIGLLCIPLVIWKVLSQRKIDSLTFLIVLLYTVVVCRVAGLSFVDLFFFWATNKLYYISNFPILLIASIASIYAGLSFLFKYLFKEKSTYART